jgi:hypothetical protein
MFIHYFYMLIVQFIRIQVVIKKKKKCLRDCNLIQAGKCIVLDASRLTSYKDATGEAIFLQLILLRLFLIFFIFILLFKKI